MSGSAQLVLGQPVHAVLTRTTLLCEIFAKNHLRTFLCKQVPFKPASLGTLECRTQMPLQLKIEARIAFHFFVERSRPPGASFPQ